MQTASRLRLTRWLHATFLLLLASCSDSKDCELSATCENGEHDDTRASGDSGPQAGGSSGAKEPPDASVSMTPAEDGDPVPPVMVDFGTCGDGLRASVEACDDGADLNTGVYGGCNPDCTKAPFCGDGLVSDGELCDPAALSRQSADAGQCDPNCGLDARCGDGKRTGEEACDFGDDKNTGEYGGCTDKCEKAPHCGDSSIDMPDGEQCDLGTAGNDGAYSGCNFDCTLAPRCGDGIKDPTEQCDLGEALNDGGFGGCNANCTLAPACDPGKGQTECDGLCAVLETDENNCGACGKKCESGYACEGGTCKIQCGGETRCGNDLCIDTTSDVNRCGGCENSQCTTSVANADPICRDSSCGFKCNNGFNQCDSACVNLTNNKNHCGACGKTCKAPTNGSSSCQSSNCETACDSGFTKCGSQCFNAQTDVKHCGGCTPCQEKPNSEVSCSGGTCEYGCGTKPSLSCHTATSPACGTWNFDTGVEGWYLLAGAGSDGPLRSEGSRLVVPTEIVGFNNRVVHFGVDFCPSGASVPTFGKTVRFRIRYESDPGFSLVKDETEFSPQLLNGETLIDSTSESSPEPGDWYEVEPVFPQQAAVTSLRIFVIFYKEWRGRILIDSVSMN